MAYTLRREGCPLGAVETWVFDLDNTLWSGVVGDDGLEGIILGEGSAVGEAHLMLQRYAKQLKELHLRVVYPEK